jgi:hypothetical protein
MNDQNKNIVIEEQDLFNYVFFTDIISNEKKEIIESDKSFDEILEFYTHLKLNSNNEPDEILKKKIASKIPAYSFSNVIKLYVIEDKLHPNQNVNRLAAGSKELKPKMTTKSFVDNDKEYLIKVLDYEDHTKLYVFSTKDEIVKNFDVVIEPDNLKYHFEDNTEPLLIKHSIEADKIELRFND